MRALSTVMVACAFTAAASADIVSRDIEYQDRDTVLEGYLAWDDAVTGPRPGVIVVHEWWGLNDHPRERARMLAELGYVAFALDMYGKGKRATTAAEAGQLSGQFKSDADLAVSRFRAALEVLKEQPQADAARIGAIGFCFGGTMVLGMARAGLDLDGVVSFHGGLESPLRAEPGQVKAQVLVLNGGDDPLVSEESISAFKKEMREAGAKWQFVDYGGAVHSFTNREADARGSAGVAYDETADKRSWAEMQRFFQEIFAE